MTMVLKTQNVCKDEEMGSHDICIPKTHLLFSKLVIEHRFTMHEHRIKQCFLKKIKYLSSL